MKPIRRFNFGLAAGVAVALGAGALAAPLTIPNTFTPGTPARAADVNANFAAVAAAVNGSESRLTTLEARAAQPSLTLNGNLVLEESAAGAGNIVKPAGLFVHDFGTESVFVGIGAGNLDLLGGYNAGIGERALALLSTGSYNAALGASTLASNTTGSANTAIGAYALFTNVDGRANTAAGASALALNTSGARNVAVGVNALHDNTSGEANTAVGHFALQNSTHLGNTALGASTLQNLSNGSFNVAIGLNAGYFLEHGYENIYVGSRGVPDESRTVRIGEVHTRAFIAGVRGTTTGSANAIPVVIDSNGQLGTISSSRRFKDQIADMGDASSLLLQLRPVTFYYRSDRDPNGRALQYGLVAEEVASVAPGLVARSRDGEVETVFYEFLPPMLLNEFQKQQRVIEAQTARLAKLERDITRMAALIERKLNIPAETSK